MVSNSIGIAIKNHAAGTPAGGMVGGVPVGGCKEADGTVILVLTAKIISVGVALGPDVLAADG